MILSTTDEIMGALERGDLSRDFADSFRRVLAALNEQGDAKGGITLKLSIATKGDMVAIKGEIVEKIPAAARRTSNFFVTREGQLSLQHPDQVEMFGTSRRSREAQDA
ncbi:hypothetical protein [Methylorubrum populi]